MPALAENGLFRHLHDCLVQLRGYYSTLHVIVLLAHMALCRIKAVEQLQYQPPGELGKLLGLDRVPEVRCLRRKLAALSLDDGPKKWAGLLSRDWLEAAPELAGTLYVDGHVRLYHGSQTALPKRYVSRQRLCLRGTTDYWVNDALGQPFFAVERPIDHGLLEALRSDIVPRLLKDVPGQPTAAELKADRYRARFVILFDREGYSPEFFKEMWQTHRIACITYHKYPKDDWPAAEFAEIETTLPGGERVALQLAERGTWIGDKKSGLWVREVRKLTPSGHQVSLISTAYGELALQDAAQLFSRWSQENFLRYMMQHYAIDLLNEYRTEEIPETKRPVVNPQWRELDRQRRSVKSKLTHHQARFAALTLHPQSDEAAQSKWEKRKAELVEAIEQFDHQLTGINSQLKTTPSHLDWDKLPETEKFQRLAPSRKQLVDTVKLIAYRAETALATIVREEVARTDDARSLLRDLFCSEADLLPDLEQQKLRVSVHPMSNPRANRESLICWSNSTRPSSPIPAPSCNSCTRSPAKPKPRTRFHNRIPQIRRSEAPIPRLRRHWPGSRSTTACGRSPAVPRRQGCATRRLPPTTRGSAQPGGRRLTEPFRAWPTHSGRGLTRPARCSWPPGTTCSRGSERPCPRPILDRPKPTSRTCWTTGGARACLSIVTTSSWCRRRASIATPRTAGSGPRLTRTSRRACRCPRLASANAASPTWHWCAAAMTAGSHGLPCRTGSGLITASARPGQNATSRVSIGQSGIESAPATTRTPTQRGCASAAVSPGSGAPRVGQCWGWPCSAMKAAGARDAGLAAPARPGCGSKTSWTTC